jgi:YidC/Oxa1 family membrane protein insertase
LALARIPTFGEAATVYWEAIDVRYEAYERLDAYNREKTLYKSFELVVRLCGGEDRDSSFILAIILIAILAKVITTPLSAAQFRSMQAMQAVQPEVKKLQEKYKGDKQQLARAQMELFKKHGVNPAASCLPMLIQMPILIGVYYGIRSFVFRFEGVSFLYISNLANPDVIAIAGKLWPGPLLLLYGVSMYLSQKLIATPAATPEQQQQQKLMAFMMPVLLVVILKSLPAAFILYWFLQNILMTGHQYLIARPGRIAAAAAGAGGKPPPPAPPGETPPGAGPPPEAIEKLSPRGTRRSKKKKKRR